MTRSEQEQEEELDRMYNAEVLRMERAGCFGGRASRFASPSVGDIPLPQTVPVDTASARNAAQPSHGATRSIASIASGDVVRSEHTAIVSAGGGSWPLLSRAELVELVEFCEFCELNDRFRARKRARKKAARKLRAARVQLPLGPAFCVQHVYQVQLIALGTRRVRVCVLCGDQEGER